MSGSKGDDKKLRIRYEPPVLLDLGNGVAYAQSLNCKDGGSPAGGQCQPGNVAVEEKCQPGGMAGGKCQGGAAAVSGKCKGGSVNSGKCDVGTSP